MRCCPRSNPAACEALWKSAGRPTESWVTKPTLCLPSTGMSWMKANVKLALEESDETVADLITEGCNMGVKSLNRYLNQYEAAEEQAKDIAKRLIGLESHLAQDMRPYL